ncbi:MAG: glycoside hydrolase 43 family protein [Muribaculum sp.]|nr:glycoside hydrolase 43 family protein [Muribaculum sp.]
MDIKTSILSIGILAGTILCPPQTQAETSKMQNPVLWADVPDPDVIRVGDDYYMVSTTMHLMPGCPVMHSKDLVNWDVVSYVFDTLDDTPYYNLEGGTVYGKGQWATSLRYHDGRFYVLFSPNDQPYKSYIYTTTDPAGKWEVLSRTRHFHDSSFLFDDDGKVYVFSGSGQIRLTELESDLSDVKKGGIDSVVIEQDEETAGLHEGSRAIKYNGKYYVMVINWPSGRPRRQLCYRADNITGPYERQVVLEDNFAGFPYAGQGTIVDAPDGNWWGVIFQDRGAVGRVLTLMPCRWTDGWPMLGNDEGKIPLTMDYDKKSEKSTAIVCSDSFNEPTLNINWQWNHCPDNSLWSLSDRKGYLRLKTSRVVSNIYEASNTISQRMEGPACSAEICMDISHMNDGDVAGFGAFNGHSTLMSVKKQGKKTYLVKHNTAVNFKDGTKVIDKVDDAEEASIEVKNKKIYLRVDGDFRLNKDTANCFYSTDGKNWIPIGNEYKMRYDYTRLFMGSRFAIYNYATKSPGGHVDVDYFDYHLLLPEPTDNSEYSLNLK